MADTVTANSQKTSLALTALQPLLVRWSALIPDHHSGISSGADFSSYKSSTILRVLTKCHGQKRYYSMAKEIYL